MGGIWGQAVNAACFEAERHLVSSSSLNFLDRIKASIPVNSFLAAVVTIVGHTPIWVWPHCVLLLVCGFQRTRDSIIPLWRMLILPIVVTLLAILSVVLAGMSALPAVLLGQIIGGPAGWFVARCGSTQRLSDGSLWLRG